MEKTVLTKENLDDILKQLGKEFICEAVSALYGGWPSLPKPEKAKAFIESIYNKNNLNVLYEEIRNMEISDNQVLKRIDKEYDGLLNEDNVEDVLAKARESLKKRKE